MTVYVLQVGACESIEIRGVFATLGSAQAAWPHGTWALEDDSEPRYWTNGDLNTLDQDHVAIITACELLGTVAG